jgi:kinesin family protein 2/24
MTLSHQQYLSCLHAGQTVDIQRSNGRIHQAVITTINHAIRTVTVEWQEKNEGKGKEVDLDAIVKLNPNLFQPAGGSSSRTGAASRNIDPDPDDHTPNDNQNNRRTRKDSDKFQRQSQAPSQCRTERPVNINEQQSPQRQQNAPLDSKKSQVVKEIERIAANREQRRAKHEKRRQKLSEVDHSIPAWEFQAMINEYRQQLGMKFLTFNDQQKDLRITVCVRKRPITKKELNKKDIDVLTVPNKDHVAVHLPKVKLDLTKYIDNQTFRFDYAMHESCTNELVYHFTAKPLVRSLFQGCNPLVFAYGQTGSGRFLVTKRSQIDCFFFQVKRTLWVAI